MITSVEQALDRTTTKSKKKRSDEHPSYRQSLHDQHVEDELRHVFLSSSVMVCIFVFFFFRRFLSVSVVGMGFLPAWECSPIISEAEEYSELFVLLRHVVFCRHVRSSSRPQSAAPSVIVRWCFGVVRLVLRGPRLRNPFAIGLGVGDFRDTLGADPIFRRWNCTTTSSSSSSSSALECFQFRHLLWRSFGGDPWPCRTAVVLCFGLRCYLSIVEVLSRAASVNVRELCTSLLVPLVVDKFGCFAAQAPHVVLVSSSSLKCRVM